MSSFRDGEILKIAKARAYHHVGNMNIGLAVLFLLDIYFDWVGYGAVRVNLIMCAWSVVGALFLFWREKVIRKQIHPVWREIEKKLDED